MPDGDRTIVIKLRDDVIVPYVDQAETALDPSLRVLWDVLVAQFPFLTLMPVYGDIRVDAIRDVLDGIRSRGEDAPNLLATFFTPCPPAQVPDLLQAFGAVLFVEYAEEVIEPVLASVDFASNPLAHSLIHTRAAPVGMDVYYAWDVPGGDGAGIRFVDVEYDWMLDHEDLIDAQVAFASVEAPAGGAVNVDHGTGVLGIVLGSDNDRGSIGIAPAVQGFVVPTRLVSNDWLGAGLARSIVVAALVVGAGGVLLIEMGRPRVPSGNHPDLPVELDRHVFDAIQTATKMGVTVIEPAGNGNIDLDGSPQFARLHRGKPTFADSGAILVAEAEPAGDAPITWTRATDGPTAGSTFGSRIDCFAPAQFHVPSSTVAPVGRGYRIFGGTSGAAAFTTGAAIAAQGMWLNHMGSFLPPAEVRRLLADFGLNTLSDGSTFANPNADRIGVMPNLPTIARSLGARRFIPISAVRLSADQIELAGVDDDNQAFHRLFHPATGWTTPLPIAPLRVAPRRPALVCRDEVRFDALIVRTSGELNLAWLDAGAASEIWLEVSADANLSPSNTLAAVPAGSGIDVYAVRKDGRLAWARSPAEHPLVQFFEFSLLDSAASFVGSAGPAAAPDPLGGTQVVAVDRDGRLRWSGRPAEGMIVTFQALVPIGGSATRVARAVRPALVGRPGVLDAFVVGVDGLLYHTSTPAFGIQGWRDLHQIGGPVPLATTGNVAAVSREPLSIDVFVIGEDGLLRWTCFALAPFVDWHDLEVIDSAVTVAATGGIAAVSRTSDTLEVFVFDRYSGELLWTRWSAGGGWTPLGPLPLEPPFL